MGHRDTINYPDKINELDNVEKIYSGCVSYFVKKNGKIFGCGTNESYQLGFRNRKDRLDSS